MTTTGPARLWLLTGLALSAGACASPTTPSVSVAAAHPVSPTANAPISFYSQPIVLRLAHGVATGTESTVTTVEVATDASFAHLVTTQAATIAADGQLTVTLTPLAGSTTYYWRAKTAPQGHPEAVSAVASFSIGPAVAIDAPVAVRPLSNTFPHRRPTFVVVNATHTGPSGPLTYEVATDPRFGSLVANGTVPEGSTQTSFTPTNDLRSGITYFWRARADPSQSGNPSRPSTPRMVAWSSAVTTCTIRDGSDTLIQTFTRTHSR
jgi:phosphodiesterase/alkaline phosphatase D-like protein